MTNNRQGLVGLLADPGATSAVNARVPVDRRLSIEELKRLAYEAVSEGVIITDPREHDNPVVCVNEGFERITGYGADETLGRNCRFLQGRLTDAAEVTRLRDAVAAGRPCQVTLLNYRKDGSTFWNRLNVTPILGDDGRPRYFVGVQSDVSALIEAQLQIESDRRELERRVEQRTKRLTRANGRLREQIRERRRAQRLASAQQQETQDFVSVIAHDLKRPILTIAGMLKLVESDAGGKMKPDQAENLTIAIAECARMRTMIDELLRLARLEQTPVLVERIDVRALIDTVVKRLQPRLDERGMKVTITGGDDRALFSRMHVEQSLHNLIENALYHGGASDKPSIHIEVTRRDKQLYIAVADNGPGIDPRDHERAFKLFQRLRVGDEQRGAGVGLPAVRRLMKRVGGWVNLHSELGRGARFTLVFPADPT